MPAPKYHTATHCIVLYCIVLYLTVLFLVWPELFHSQGSSTMNMLCQNCLFSTWEDFSPHWWQTSGICGKYACIYDSFRVSMKIREREWHICSVYEYLYINLNYNIFDRCTGYNSQPTTCCHFLFDKYHKFFILKMSDSNKL